MDVTIFFLVFLCFYEQFFSSYYLWNFKSLEKYDGDSFMDLEGLKIQRVCLHVGRDNANQQTEDKSKV